MGLDIRTPIGLMFGILGLLLVGYGFISDPAIYERSLGMNVNISWGIVMFIFGAIFTVFGRRAGRKGPPVAAAPAPGEVRAPGH